MQIIFNKKAGYYGRNRKGISVGAEVMTFNGEIIIRPINSRGVTNSCSIGVCSVSDALILADEIRKQAMAMANKPYTVQEWFIHAQAEGNPMAELAIMHVPEIAAKQPAQSFQDAINICQVFSPDNKVWEEITCYLTPAFTDYRDTVVEYGNKVISEIKSLLSDDDSVVCLDEFSPQHEDNSTIVSVSFGFIQVEDSQGEVNDFAMEFDNFESSPFSIRDLEEILSQLKS